jgi:4-hydroxy-tetrahydrodipicolinate synthase
MKISPNIPRGVWPVMVTPFNSDKTIDWYGVDALTEWYLASGCEGLFSVCGSGEMFELSNIERLALAEHVYKRVNGRVPTIAAGTFEITLKGQTDFIKKMYDTGVSAVICLANHFARITESDHQWENWADKLLNVTGDIPLGIYECPLPYHRLVSPSSLLKINETRRFFWLKETSEDILLLREKLSIVKNSQLKIFNAYGASLLDSLKYGASGYSGIATNFYPALFVWLCNNYKKDPNTALKLQDFITNSQKVVDFKYLTSAKQFLKQCGLPINTVTRIPVQSFSKREIENLQLLRDEVGEWLKKLELSPIC